MKVKLELIINGQPEKLWISSNLDLNPIERLVIMRDSNAYIYKTFRRRHEDGEPVEDATYIFEPAKIIDLTSTHAQNTFEV